MIRILLIALLLSGCTTVAHVRDTSGMQELRVPIKLCWYGVAEPELNGVAVEFLDRLGIDATVAPLPDRYMPSEDLLHSSGYEQGKRVESGVPMIDAPANRAAHMFLKVVFIPDCDIVVEYLPGSGATCVVPAILFPAPCVAALTVFQKDRLRAAMYIRVKSSRILRHEMAHALGCDHNESSDECKARVQFMKATQLQGQYE